MSSPFLAALNEAQQRAVQVLDGPVLVLAGPGSGKTRLLTHRIAYLIEEIGVDPFHILAVTFTNKAAREMKERLNGLIGGQRAAGLTVGTFHSICSRFLRRDIVHLGRERDFAIYDSDDQERLMKRVLKELSLDDKKNPPRAILSTISSAKNELVNVQEYARLNRTYYDEIVARCYERYQALLRECNALDFDDLLFETVRLFEYHPQVLASYHERYRYLLVDEYQDTNRAQYVLVRQLAARHRNLFVVGDEDQCVPGEALVTTAGGSKPIQAIHSGEALISAAGKGTTAASTVQRVRTRHYTGALVQATLRSGRVLRLTPNHMCFARPAMHNDIHYVYLIYHPDTGYRIGPHGDPQQPAEKVWILHAATSHAEATAYASALVARYGIPSPGTQPVDQLAGCAPAERLMDDLGISPGHPHYHPAAAVHLAMFGSSEPAARSAWHAHHIWHSTTGPQHGQQYADMQQAEAQARQLAATHGDAEIIRRALLGTGEPFSFQPASHLRPGMLLPRYQDEAIVSDAIVRVEYVDYDGPVYDLDVADVHNYLVEGIVVHNSIYAWRGADVRNILQFEDDYPDAQVFLLEQNYRSTQAILDTAQAVIDGGSRRKHRKRLWTQNDQGVQVMLIEGYDQNDEAQRVAEEIARLVATEGYRLSDFAIMYRTNAQSGAVEEALAKRGIRYQLIGGIRFYERKEIKDILAYLRLVANPADSVSLERIINTPSRGIGTKTVSELQRWAADLGLPLYYALRELTSESHHTYAASFAARNRKALLGFLELIEVLIAESKQLDVQHLLDSLLERLSFRDALVQEYGPDDAEERWEYVQALYGRTDTVMGLAQELQLRTFLEEVALIADIDTLDSQADAVTCITLHQAKGLEYPVVFLIGLEEGRLPHSRSMDDKDSLDEERRLLYVGATRARERLYLLYAFRRTMYGRTDISTPSRFLKDIPRELLKQPGKRATISTPPASTLLNRSSGPAPASSSVRPSARQRQPASAQLTFFAGQRVRHSTFGEGIVVSSKLIEGDEEVIVNFATKGEKKLLASFARLQRIG